MEEVKIPWSIIEALLGDPNNKNIVQQIRELAEAQLPDKFHN